MGRNCRHYSVRGRSRVRRNSTDRHCTSSLGHKPARYGEQNRLDQGSEWYCWAADDSRAGSHNSSDGHDSACERARRTQRPAAATGESSSIGIGATLAHHIRTVARVRFKSNILRSRQQWRAQSAAQFDETFAGPDLSEGSCHGTSRVRSTLRVLRRTSAAPIRASSAPPPMSDPGLRGCSSSWRCSGMPRPGPARPAKTMKLYFIVHRH